MAHNADAGIGDHCVANGYAPWYASIHDAGAMRNATAFVRDGHRDPAIEQLAQSGGKFGFNT